MPRPVVFSGLDLVAPELPEATLILQPDAPSSPLPSASAALDRALSHPNAGEPLAERVARGSRVLLVIDDPLGVVAPPELHPLGAMIEAVLRVVRAAGGSRVQVSALVANGLGRALAPAEWSEVVGAELAARVPVRFHDAEAYRGHTRLGEQQLDAELFDAALVVHLGVRRQGPVLPLDGLVRGLSTYPGLAPLRSAGVQRERLIQERAAALIRELAIFSAVAVMSAGALSPGLEAALDSPGRPMHTWNRLPYAIRRRLASGWRSASGICAVFAGDPLEVEAQANQRILRELQPARTSPVDAPPVDALVVPVPDLSPFSRGAITNPVLAAHLGVVSLAVPALPRVKVAGPVVLLNPLREEFDLQQHLPYSSFYRQVLSSSAGSVAEAEVTWSGRPELVASYRRRHAVHGAHPFMVWGELQEARARMGPVISAGGGTAAAQRLGLEPADDWSEAYDRVKDLTGLTAPVLGILRGFPTWA